MLGNDNLGELLKSLSATTSSLTIPFGVAKLGRQEGEHRGIFSQINALTSVLFLFRQR